VFERFHCNLQICSLFCPGRGVATIMDTGILPGIAKAHNTITGMCNSVFLLAVSEGWILSLGSQW